MVKPLQIWRFLAFLIFLLPLVSFSSEAQTSRSIEVRKVAKEVQSLVRTLELKSVDDSIQYEWSNKIQQLKENSKLRINNGRYLELLDRTFQNLFQQKKILMMNEAFKMGLIKANPKNQKMRGLYIPLIHTIVLSEELTDEQRLDSLYHEVVHAFQYTYRFPLDLYGFHQEMKGRKPLKEEQVFEYLSFLYESQANWYTLRQAPSYQWKSLIRPTTDLEFELKSAIHGLSLTLTTQLTKLFIKQYISNADKVGFFTGYIAEDNVQFNFQITEMILLNTHSSTFFPGVSIDFKFFKEYSEAMEQAYFDNVDFMFNQKAHYQKRFIQLHNLFNTKILWASKSEFKSCQPFLQEVEQDEDSPLAFWLTVSEEKAKSCSFYSPYVKEEYQESFWNEIKKNAASPFRLVYPGGEGSSPDLELSPHFHPQYELTPLRK
ncbi:MAG: hypothetical protein ACOYL6_15345 [Bacteriovoracaceae bacterium]